MAAVAKTNAMRALDQRKIPYVMHDYSASGAVSGIDVASVLGEDPRRVFKTLVTVGSSQKYYVFVVPVSAELDLKKAASAVSEKWVEMIKAKDLLPLTGYIHGGCSPIGMKKTFPTLIDCSVENYPTFCVSGGRIGCQIELSTEALSALVPFRLASLTVDR